MSLISLVRYLLPEQEKHYPQFRAEIERLSAIGLRVIGFICVSAPLLTYMLGLVWFPELPATAMVWGDVGQVFLGLGAIGLSFLPRARPSSRAIGIFVGGGIAFLQTTSMALSASFHEAAFQAPPETHFPMTLMIVLLVGMAALPVRPLQVLGLGTTILAWSVVMILSEKGIDGLSGWTGLPLVLSIVIVLMCTGLTAVMYHQRSEGFLARKRAEDSFEELRAAHASLLIARNATTQGRFAAAMSHELNTPLGSLASSFETLVTLLEQLRRYLEADSRKTSVFEDASRSGRLAYKRLNEIVDRMRHLTNLDRAEEQVVNLNELCTDIVAFLQVELESRGKIRLDLEPLPPLKCRPQQISAVLSNLLLNAAESFNGGGQIDVVTRRRSGEVVMEVRDNGRGIASERLPTLFEPVFRVEGGRVTTTNWGLFISRSIIAEHGGSLHIESVVGRGTTATIRLPVLF